MSDASARTATDALAEELEAAAARLERAEADVDDVGEDALERVAAAADSFRAFIDENDGKATGSGREAFKAYVAFQDELVARIERLPDDLLVREAFEEVGELLDKRRLSPADMERAREAIRPAIERAALLEDRRDARDRYRRARTAVVDRLRTIESDIAEHERLLEFADVDLDASLAPIRGPITAYNAAVRDAFSTFVQEAPARAVFDLLDTATDYPLVGMPPAPDRLARYLRTDPVGEQPIHRLIEFADYSTSKLGHYVADASRFRAIVSANRTYLDRLDAEPLTVEWPPPSAGQLRYRGRELVAVVDRFADEKTVARLHELRSLPRRPDYGSLRHSAVARDRLDPTQRERLQSGAVARALTGLETERDRLETILDRFPTR